MRALRARPLRWIGGLLLSITFLVLLAPTTVGGAATYVIVSGKSMSPTFEEGDLVVVRRGRYQIGEVIAFETGRGVVIHRIVGGSGEEGFVMQGDNKESADSWRPTSEDVIGEELVTIPRGGHWARRIAGSPALLGVTIGGLGSLMLWSPKRRRRRGAHAGDGSRPRTGTSANATSVRGAGTALIVLSTTAALLAGVTTYLFLRPPQRVEALDRVRYEHSGEFAYTAVVEDSVVYDSPTISSPADGADPTAIYTELLQDLIVDFDYRLASPAPSGLTGTLSADLHMGTGESVWTRTIPLLEPSGFSGPIASGSFSVDIDRVLGLLTRAELETGLIPGIYQAQVVARVELDDGSGARDVFVSELPLELRDKLLVVTNDLTSSETVSVTEEVAVPNDLSLFGFPLAMRVSRALSGSVLTMVVVGGLLYWATVRRRIGRGEAARINLRYGSLIVPVTGQVQNGNRHVDVASMADLARLARRAEQMVFHAEPTPGEHRYLVPDGPVTYQYRPARVVD